MKSVLFLSLMGFLRYWPLPWLRTLGWVLGSLLYCLAPARRKVVHANLRLCFPNLTEPARARLARQHVVCFVQAILDRSWLWGRSPACLRKRLRFEGDLTLLQSKQPLVLFVPHFVGLDACGTALSALLHLPGVSIYLPQSVEWVNKWMQKGRMRFGNVVVYSRYDSPKKIAQALRRGRRLFLLPDMDFGHTADTLFVPFFGQATATIPSLSRFARIGKAQVLTLTASLSSFGYRVQVHTPWQNFPTKNETADTARMNHVLEDLIESMPAQYFWVHRRFKTRPKGTADVY